MNVHKNARLAAHRAGRPITINGGMVLLLAAFVVMVFDVGWRLRKGLTAWLAPLDANWTEEQNLIKELRAFPVEVLGPLARRIKTEIQLNDRVGGRLLRLELLLNEACLGDRR